MPPVYADRAGLAPRLTSQSAAHPQADPRGGQAREHVRHHVDQRICSGAVLDQPYRLVPEGGVRGQRARQPRAEQQRQPAGEDRGRAGEQTEQQRGGDVHGECAPGEHRIEPGGDGPVGEIAQRRPDRAADEDQQQAHACRPTYRTTCTSSSTTSPSVTNSSSCGRKPLMCSAESMITMATGRSSDRLSSREVWIREEAPYPSMPWNTLAPARPAACARCTISV